MGRRATWEVKVEETTDSIILLLPKVLSGSHNIMEEADELCDRVAIVDEGRIVALDTPSILKKKHGWKIFDTHKG